MFPSLWNQILKIPLYPFVPTNVHFFPLTLIIRNCRINSHTFNSPLLFIFHTNNLNEWNHLFNIHSNSLITDLKINRNFFSAPHYLINRNSSSRYHSPIHNYTWSMIYNLCNNRGTHPHSALHEDLLVPSTTNSSNQLHLTLVPATKFSARACIKLLFSTLSCISIFVPNVFNHYTSKNRHQSFTFPPLITFLPLIVNRIPAGIG